jgi:hypothetical protein
MAHILQTRRGTDLTEWPGRVSNADPHDIPPGAGQVQDNLVCLRPGVLSARGGLQRSTALSGSDADGLISLFGMQRFDGNMALSVDDGGRLKSRRGSTITSLATSLAVALRWHFEKDRRGRVILTSGLQRGYVWDGFSSAPDALGIDPPTTTHSVATPSGGAATAGDYVAGYRFVDDRLPPSLYSSISTLVAATAALNDKFEHTGLGSSSQGRVKKVEIWRSAADAPNVLYLVKSLGHNGSITSSADNGSSFVRFTVPTGHGLVVGARITVSGHSVAGYNTTHQITAIAATTVDTGAAYSADGTGGTWVIEGYMADTASDNTLIAAAADDPNARLVVLNPNGTLNARRFAPPPNWKCVCKSFQDRFWYAVDAVYTTGTVALTSGSATATGTGTAFTSAMAGRYLYVQGASQAYLIDSVGSGTSLTLSKAAAESVSTTTYAIRPSPSERNSLYFSETDEAESVPRINVIEVQENTDDDDEITGLMPFGAVLYVMKNRHCYSLSFVSQPLIDVSVRMISQRGMFNPRCYDFFESTAYVMDSAGCYTMGLGGQSQPISGAIQDLFRDTIDLSKSQWFHVHVDPIRELAYFFVAFTGDSGTYPKRALVYNLRTGGWNTESYFDEIGDAAKLEISGRLQLLLGGDRDRVLLAGQDGPDMLTAHVRGTATAGGATTLTDSAANFAAFPVGTPIAIVGGTGQGQLRYVASNTSTVITVSSAWTTNPSTDSVYLVGAILYQFKSGIFALQEEDQHHEVACEVVFQPTAGDNTLTLRTYLNHDTTAVTQKLTTGLDLGGNVTRTKGSTNIDAPLKSTDAKGATTPGRAYVNFGNHLDHRAGGDRWITAELEGFKGDNDIDIYSLTVMGAE